MRDKTKAEKAESDRKQRLGAALRANLKRRKAQARDRNGKTPAGGSDDTAIPDDGEGHR